MPTKNTPPIPIILSALDQVEKATAPDFFYARLRARMEQAEPAQQHWWQLRLSPAILPAALLLFLIINMVALKTTVPPNPTSTNVAESNASGMESFAKEYQLYTETIY